MNDGFLAVETGNLFCFLRFLNYHILHGVETAHLFIAPAFEQVMRIENLEYRRTFAGVKIRDGIQFIKPEETFNVIGSMLFIKNKVHLSGQQFPCLVIQIVIQVCNPVFDPAGTDLVFFLCMVARQAKEKNDQRIEN